MLLFTRLTFINLKTVDEASIFLFPLFESQNFALHA